MNKNIIFITIIVLGGILAIGFLFRSAPAGEEGKEYSSGTGFTFTYPAYYDLTERELGNGERRHRNLTLIDSRLPKPPVGGEGPPAISIDVYQNDLERLSAREWVTGNNNSNFKLSPTGETESFSFAGREALSYEWDGLYRGETVAVATPQDIYAFSVTWLQSTDQIRRDFYRLLETVSLPPLTES